MSRKKLRTEQVTDVQVFVQVSRLFFFSTSSFLLVIKDIAPIREAKMFTLLLSVSNEVNTIVVNTSPYTVSADLEVWSYLFSCAYLAHRDLRKT